jgi:hypothetical protein
LDVSQRNFRQCVARKRDLQILYHNKIAVTMIEWVQSSLSNAAIRTAGTQQMIIPLQGIIVSTTTIAPITAAKVEAEQCQGSANENAVNQTDK